MSRYAIIFLMAFFPVIVFAGKKDAPPPPPATNLAQRVRGFQVPQYSTNGLLTSMLRGKEALIYPDRMADITGLVLDLFKNTPTGRVSDVTVTSPRCFYQAEKGFAVSDDSIRIARDNMVITGSNYVIDQKSERMQINSNVKVVLVGVQSSGLAGLPGMNTSKPPKKADGTQGK